MGLRGPTARDVYERFEEKVERIPESGCHIFTAGRSHKHGYGGFWYDGKMDRSHRVAYKIYVGKIPPNAHILHRCDVPACVNPDHLFLGDQVTNMKDMWKKGRGVTPTYDGRHGGQI